MARKVFVWWFIMGAGLVLVLTGCQQAQMALKFNVNDSSTYKVSTEVLKDFKFEQPTLGKVKEEQTATRIETTFQQQIESTDEKGAVANITIKDIKYLVTEKGEVKFDFDSSRQADQKDPFAKLIGQSYKIRITPGGSVEVVDAAKALAVVTEGYAGKVAASFMNEKSIIGRHEVLALPPGDKNVLKAGDKWTTVKASPPGLLVPKSFAKNYTLKKIESTDGTQVAAVEMQAVESTVPAKDLPAQGASNMGPFAKMFDTEDSFTGKMLLDITSGRVKEYTEKLVVKYIVAESPPNQPPDKGPDTLMISFTHSISTALVK